MTCQRWGCRSWFIWHVTSPRSCSDCGSVGRWGCYRPVRAIGWRLRREGRRPSCRCCNYCWIGRWNHMECTIIKGMVGCAVLVCAGWRINSVGFPSAEVRASVGLPLQWRGYDHRSPPSTVQRSFMLGECVPYLARSIPASVCIHFSFLQQHAAPRTIILTRGATHAHTLSSSSSPSSQP